MASQKTTGETGISRDDRDPSKYPQMDYLDNSGMVNKSKTSSATSPVDESSKEMDTEESYVEKSIKDSSTFDKPSDDDGITSSFSSPEDALTALLQIAASTGRGEFAKPGQKNEAEKLISILELNNPTPGPTKDDRVYGTWELLYSSTQLFRSSPFFMAGRAVCTTADQAQQYDWFCDMHRKALAISSIGPVRQIVSPSSLVSEFEVTVGAIPFFNWTPFTPFPYSGGLPFTIDGAIVSSADITATGDGSAWELYMDTVQIRGSNVPGLRRFLDDGLQLNSRDLASFLEDNVNGYTTPRPMFKTTYLSEKLRISRDQDGKVFVYVKVSDDTSPTDYSRVEADLGLLKFLEGLNDNIIKYYE
jgi:hypothetical protein